jgi:hypothetical protein
MAPGAVCGCYPRSRQGSGAAPCVHPQVSRLPWGRQFAHRKIHSLPVRHVQRGHFRNLSEDAPATRAWCWCWTMPGTTTPSYSSPCFDRIEPYSPCCFCHHTVRNWLHRASLEAGAAAWRRTTGSLLPWTTCCQPSPHASTAGELPTQCYGDCAA